MSALLRERDWSTSPLGAPETWPPALRTAMRLLLTSGHPIYLFWGKHALCFYNDAYRLSLGAEMHPNSLGQPAREVWAEIWDAIGSQIDQVMAGGEPTWHENQLIPMTRHGHREDAYWTYSYSPIDDDSAPHNVGGVLVICTEITEQVQMAKQLQREGERFAELFSRAPSFMAVLRGAEHRVELANASFMRLVGQRQLLGRTLHEALPELVEQGFVEHLDHVFHSGEPFVANGVVYARQVTPDADPEALCVDFVFQPITDAEGAVTGIFVEGSDVTDRARAESALRRSEAELLALNASLESRINAHVQGRGRVWQLTTDLLGILNTRGYFEASNPAWQVVLGWSAKEIGSVPFFDFLHSDDVPKSQLAFAQAVGRGDAVLHLENRYRHRNGGYRWLSWAAIPEGNKIYCSARDITAEKAAAAALAKTEEALRQSQKMEAVGQLTGGLAHDFNNLLGGMMGSLDVIRMRLAQGRLEDIERFIDMGASSVKRAASLTQRLLAFSRRQTLDPRATDTNRLVEGMVELLRRTIGPQIELEVIAQKTLWLIHVDPPQLENALLNLCINARDAMPDGGRVTVKTANLTLGVADAGELTPGDYVVLSVADTGIGMSAEVIARAFDPFFTTKPLGEGTGLGLSMIYGFARQSGGRVSIQSTPDCGSTLRLMLPRHHGTLDASDAQAAATSDANAGRGISVLVVDDESAIREFVGEVLIEQGYQVLQAQDAASALRLVQSKAVIDLLITDVGLPGGMNGRQMADAARELMPELTVLFITGYAEATVLGQRQLGRNSHLLTKPFTLAELAKRVQEIVQARVAPE